MAIKYSLIERGEPGVVGGGTKKWYANVALDREFSVILQYEFFDH